MTERKFHDQAIEKNFKKMSVNVLSTLQQRCNNDDFNITFSDFLQTQICIALDPGFNTARLNDEDSLELLKIIGHGELLI